jgi:hypothetical protein
VSPGGAGSSDRAVISFRDRELFSLRDKDGHRSIKDRSLPAIQKLNQLWERHRPVSIRLRQTDAARVKIAIDDFVVVETLPIDAAGEEVPIVARRWAEALRKAFESGAPGTAIATTKGAFDGRDPHTENH